MDELPDLSKLDHAQKDALIRELWPQVRELAAQVTALQARVAELEGRLVKNSRNSSKPPSSDGLKKPKSLRVPGQRSSGGQNGHAGKSLKRVAQPDRIVPHAPPTHCEACGLPLKQGEVVETRQVFDLPPLRFEVTEHQVLEARCACGTLTRGQFPAEVSAPVQYGPAVRAAVVHLTQHHMLPVERTAELMGDLFELPMSDATVVAAIEEAQARLAPTVDEISRALQAAPVAGADETGIRVAGKLHWLHVLVTGTLTWMGCHARRGKAAFEAFGLLTAFVGTLIHDGWRAYRDLLCAHGLCNAHHLRELTYVFEQCTQGWAKRMIDLLLAALEEVTAAGGPLPAPRIEYYRSAYAAILAEGEAANPLAPPSGKRGRTRQSYPANLLRRLREYTDDVLRFITDADVPFANNLAEQAVRMPKVKQKISGGFRTEKGAQAFCTIRSYLATLHKQGANLFHALVLTFQGNPPQPSFD